MPLGGWSQHRDLRVGKRIMTRLMTWLIAAGLVAGAAGATSAQTHAHGHTGQATHSRAGSDTTATRESKAAHARMMRNMAMPFTGDPDVDFRMHMIPHHQGAIDMARVALRHAKDAWTRQAAQAIIIAQQQEISEFQAWLARRGAMVPPGGQPPYIVTANTYPDPQNTRKEPGSQNELVGQTWAPGSGVRPQPQVSERAAHSRAGSDTSATGEFKAAHALMMRNMAVPFTGDPDVDFRMHMIPHHQGAIDMARVALRHAKDAWTRQVADAIITAQQQEIYEFKAWLARHGTSAAHMPPKQVGR